MSERTGTCEDCSTTFAAGSRGVIPRRCPTCAQLHRRQQEKVWAAARPPREKKTRTLTCEDCYVDFEWTVIRGPLPVRCKPCAKSRRLAATRERGRVRRAAAKVGDTRRHTVCIDCFAEFVAPERGALPRRCPECTATWNKVRYKKTANRSAASRRLHLQKKYGMTPEEWDVLYENQNGLCAICKEPGEQEGRRFHVDHCHDSGSVRGLLCHGCNTAIGHLRDDPEIMRAAAEYVESRGSATLS